MSDTTGAPVQDRWIVLRKNENFESVRIGDITDLDLLRYLETSLTPRSQAHEWLIEEAERRGLITTVTQA